MTQDYIGVKQVTAWEEVKDGKEGYAVKYEDGYISWSPKETFEKYYLPMGHGADPSKINSQMVDNFFKNVNIAKLGEKTLAYQATLVNGFELLESASCVDKANFSESIGSDICKSRASSKVWELLGFVLQWARNGIKP